MRLPQKAAEKPEILTPGARSAPNQKRRPFTIRAKTPRVRIVTGMEMI
jgi:hypothetical protein